MADIVEELESLRARVRALPTGVELDAYAPDISTTREFQAGAVAMKAVVMTDSDATLESLAAAEAKPAGSEGGD